jgi:phosphatidylethanolamine/phosphatidyl-N-methylethanolamine N-methyltransferase
MRSKIARGYHMAFIKELAANFRQLGQVAPSSKSLCKKLTDPLDSLTGPRRILEAGPGTGVVTRELLKVLRDSDELVVCEINPRLLDILKAKLSKTKEFQERKAQVTFICAPVQHLQAVYQQDSFDAIVSSLPFTNFSAEMVMEVLSLYEVLLRPGGILTFYEYLALRRVGQLFRNKRDRARVKEVELLLTNWEKRLSRQKMLEQKISLLNLPPAKVLVANMK